MIVMSRQNIDFKLTIEHEGSRNSPWWEEKGSQVKGSVADGAWSPSFLQPDLLGILICPGLLMFSFYFIRGLK